MTRADRVTDAEAHRLARFARRSADSPPPESEVPREPWPGDKGVSTHAHSELRGQSLDLARIKEFE